MFMRQLWLVMKQTFMTRVKTGGYWMLVLSPLLIVAFIGGITFVTNAMNSSDTPTVAVVNQPALTKVLNADKNLDAKLVDVSSKTAAENDLAAKKIDGLLTEQDGKYTYSYTSESHTIDQNNLQVSLNQFTMMNKAQGLKLTTEELTSLMTPPALSMVMQSNKGQADGGLAKAANFALAGALGILIFVFLSAYVSMIAQEIANEKSSRIMEILLAMTSPAVQFFGKISGIALLAILHAAIYVAVGIGVAIVAPKNEMLLKAKSVVAGVDWGFGVMTIAIVFVAIVLYMVLTAMIAAMVNDLSQVQQAVSPVTYLSMISYMLTFMLSGNSHNIILQGLSYLPFFSQTLMPARLGLQYATMTDAAVALILELLALIVLGYYGLRVYKKNVLTYQEGSLFKPIWRGMTRIFKKKI
ncbi:ABC transporter permease [Weissella ceti]|uniref:ABC transporter permease n=1 Tax=Weissella ceti TaxID=759620 RepID=A0ABT3E2X4_9LACO|nr:ABC transporter permease [Weissella ceti]MCW0952758.1 ABC transporter permease [Weissella ceti]QVK12457.1 ABC transporter permease [Weissella ceti]